MNIYKLYNFTLIGICLLYLSACESEEGFVEIGDFKYKLSNVADLQAGLDECSGFINVEDELICINDGGPSGAVLYYFNPESGEQILFPFSEISNKDWEAIANTNEEIIVFDTGNNKGQRTSLDIHHIDILSKKVNYTNTFTLEGMPAADPQSHNLDIEAAFIKDGKYCLFTKNRADKNTNLFVADLGIDDMQKLATLPVPAMVTDAYYHERSGSVLLLCNEKADDRHISYITIAGINDRNELTLKADLPIMLDDKVEAITLKENDTFYIGSENVSGGLGQLYEIRIKGL